MTAPHNKPPARWSWRCWLGLHHWTAWSAERTMSYTNGDTVLGQDRYCTVCNRSQTVSCKAI